jgi:hypothetical protein
MCWRADLSGKTSCWFFKQAILYIERNPQIVRSITSFPDIANSI